MSQTYEEVGLVGYRDEKGEFVSESFDPENPKHIDLLELFACNCPECQAVLDRARGAHPFQPDLN